MLRRWWNSESRVFGPNRTTQVVEPEMDMSRTTPRRSPIVTNVARIFRWMLPESKTTGAPTRAVAREQEEVFPSRDL